MQLTRAPACRHAHLNTLVKVAGVVTRRTGVYPQMAVLWYNCRACGGSIGPLMQSGDAATDVRPASCPNCEGRGPFVIDQQQTVYRNYQKITLQVRLRCSMPPPARPRSSLRSAACAAARDPPGAPLLLLLPLLLHSSALRAQRWQLADIARAATVAVVAAAQLRVELWSCARSLHACTACVCCGRPCARGSCAPRLQSVGAGALRLLPRPCVRLCA